LGSTSTQLIQEPVSPEALIEQTLGEIFRVYPKADVSISYRFGHSHAVSVHAQKVGRVFSNIVGNAVQAMNMKGQLWFSTRESTVDNCPFIEFSLGNAGSVIPPENLAKLFEAFFTSGKKGGAGLGLAIAQKVVNAHGGRIWCESERTEAHPDGQVEFKFTLPVAVGQPAKAAGKLPQHSSEVTRELLVEADQPSPTSPDSTGLALEAAILDLAKAKGRPFQLLVVDDEGIYRAALVSSLARTPELAAAVTVSEAQDGAEGLAKLVGLPDLVITDVDMGHQVDGFDLVEAMRAAGFNGLVCVHSNRMVAEDHRAAFESGADTFIPKPMARAQLLKLVIQAGQKARVPERQGAVAATSVAGKPEVLIVEDNIFIQEAWQFALGDEATVHTLGTYEEVVERLETDPGFASRLLLAVTDMHLDGSSGDGLDVGRLLKNHRAGLRVLLSSDGVLTPGELVGAIDRTIGKDPVGLAALSSL
jgi:CheY-like chemotaxis protein